MNIKHSPPPNYEEIRKHFPFADYEKGTLFTYGDTVYCKNITPDLEVHEEVHVKQQMEMGPEKWWEKYFVDPKFRLHEESAAYHAQWKFIDKNFKDREMKSKLLMHIVSSLSGPLYNNLINQEQAKEIIKYGTRTN